MDETDEIVRLCVRALVAQMGEVPGVEMHLTRDCVLGLTGEPSADFNRLTLGADPDAEGFLISSVARAKARGLPLHAVMSPRAADALAPVATRLGLTLVGASPLMVLRAGTPVAPSRPVKITRALGSELVGIAAQNVSAIMGELEGIGAIIRRRERVAGMRGPGRVHYFMNPNVGTHLPGSLRDEAQADAPPGPLLRVMEGGKAPRASK